MHQARKGKQWHFGMKMHTGVDAESGLIHSVVYAASNEANVVHAHELLHGQECQLHGGSGHTGMDKRDGIKAAQDEGRLRNGIDWRIAVKRGVVKAKPVRPRKALDEWFERRKAQVRAIVEHPFHVIKNLFRYRKVSCRGIARNEARAKVQAALANLCIARRHQHFARGPERRSQASAPGLEFRSADCAVS
jgi:transposase, IS5 family